MAKIRHFPAILSEKDQRLYTFQPYDLVQKSSSRARRWPTGLVAMRDLKKKRKKVCNYRQINGVVGYTTLITLQHLRHKTCIMYIAKR